MTGPKAKSSPTASRPPQKKRPRKKLSETSTGFDAWNFEPIAVMETDFKEKFGIPRQVGMAANAKGVIRFKKDFRYSSAVRDLDRFSHIWVVFVFHQTGGDHGKSYDWKPTIRPPRLGGAKKVGVLASRSPHRPNPIGLSALRLEKIEVAKNGDVSIHVEGVDILDGTPILDIKPYLPYADQIPDAKSGWAEKPIERNPVLYAPGMMERLEDFARTRMGLVELVEDLLSLDPRPAFQRRRKPAKAESSYGLKYGFAVKDLDIQWTIEADGFRITAVDDLETAKALGRIPAKGKKVE
ncbi:MAG: tRNA (N6-threonylcarbamoyladenosine(37)-N6)-methyltransferase TrmO [Bdellovibrionales bacterium]|nr:tRNA (N6-threonylcarbamoyladenosine(37)-N6)-methyltransferase TrmO [Bdellovibrionales bacterium]